MVLFSKVDRLLETALNRPKFTASVVSVPAARPVIFLVPMKRPLPPMEISEVPSAVEAFFTVIL